MNCIFLAHYNTNTIILIFFILFNYKFILYYIYLYLNYDYKCNLSLDYKFQNHLLESVSVHLFIFDNPFYHGYHFQPHVLMYQGDAVHGKLRTPLKQAIWLSLCRFFNLWFSLNLNLKNLRHCCRLLHDPSGKDFDYKMQYQARTMCLMYQGDAVHGELRTPLRTSHMA